MFTGDSDLYEDLYNDDTHYSETDLQYLQNMNVRKSIHESREKSKSMQKMKKHKLQQQKSSDIVIDEQPTFPEKGLETPKGQHRKLDSQIPSLPSSELDLPDPDASPKIEHVKPIKKK
eukprot:UN09214